MAVVAVDSNRSDKLRYHGDCKYNYFPDSAATSLHNFSDQALFSLCLYIWRALV